MTLNEIMRAIDEMPPDEFAELRDGLTTEELAAVAMRLDATIVGADNDFDALAVKRAHWRATAP